MTFYRGDHTGRNSVKYFHFLPIYIKKDSQKDLGNIYFKDEVTTHT